MDIKELIELFRNSDKDTRIEVVQILRKSLQPSEHQESPFCTDQEIL